jgi:hypothetical protein
MGTVSGTNTATIFNDVTIMGVNNPDIRYIVNNNNINTNDWKGCCLGRLQGTLSGYITLDIEIGNLFTI